MTTPWPDFVCPRCRSDVRLDGPHSARAYVCGGCAARYPVIAGIPDFRVEPDPWIGLREDREKGRRLAERTAGENLETMVRTYWEMTPDTPPARVERFVQHVVRAEPRAAEWLRRLDERECVPPPGPWLDVGCGTGDLVVAAARAGARMVGIDVAFRWLVVARRRLELAGEPALLVCCNAEHLPFRDGSFARALSLGTLEHCRDAEGVVRDVSRVLVSSGQLALTTVNRYSALREPHVDVWGVGYVPRRFADRYVRLASGQSYLHHRPLSVRELRRGLDHAGLSDVRVAPAPVLADHRARLGRLSWAADVYEAAREAPLLSAPLSWVAPVLHARGTAP